MIRNARNAVKAAIAVPIVLLAACAGGNGAKQQAATPPPRPIMEINPPAATPEPASDTANDAPTTSPTEAPLRTIAGASSSTAFAGQPDWPCTGDESSYDDLMKASMNGNRDGMNAAMVGGVFLSPGDEVRIIQTDGSKVNLHVVSGKYKGEDCWTETFDGQIFVS